MDETRIKATVQKRYASIARSKSCGCSCGCSGSDGKATRLVEYGSLAADMVAGSDLGLGCGIPTQFAGISRGETVLDLGSGAGADVFLAARAVGPEGRVIGVDMTPEMVARARDNAARSGYTNVEFRLGEIEALPVADASVDVVISNCVINLVPDKGRAFAEIHRVLKSGGRFCISDIVSYGDVPETVRQDAELWAGCVAGAMDKSAYLRLVEQAGFAAIRVENLEEYSQFQGEGYGFASITLRGEKP